MFHGQGRVQQRAFHGLGVHSLFCIAFPRCYVYTCTDLVSCGTTSPPQSGHCQASFHAHSISLLYHVRPLLHNNDVPTHLGAVFALQQEAASREWRIRAQQAAAELSALQRALVDKDAELESACK